MHGEAAAVDDLHHRLQRQHARVGGQSVVLAHRVAGEKRPLIQGRGLAHLRHLRHTQSGHRDLGELRQKQHTLRVVETLPLHNNLNRVVPHDLQHAEAQLGAGVRIRTIPHAARSSGTTIGVHTHALGLDALAGESIEGGRRRHHSRSLQHKVAVDRRGDLADLAAARSVVNTCALHHKLDARTGQDRGEHGGCVFHHAASTGCGALLSDISTGGDQFRDRRGPHAVNDHTRQPGQRGRSIGDVDGVAVAGNDRETRHILRRSHRCLRAEGTRRVHHARQDRGIGAGNSLATATTDGETLAQCCHRLAILAQSGADNDDAPHVRIAYFLRTRLNIDARAGCRQGLFHQLQVVFQVHQRQHAFNH